MKRFALVALAAILASCGLAAPAPPAATIIALTPAPIRLALHRPEDWPAVLDAYRTTRRAVAFYAPWERTIHARTTDWRFNLPHEMSHALEHARGSLDYSLDPACVARDPPDAGYVCQRTEERARAYEAQFFTSCSFAALGLFGVPGDAVCAPKEDSMAQSTPTVSAFTGVASGAVISIGRSPLKSFQAWAVNAFTGTVVIEVTNDATAATDPANANWSTFATLTAAQGVTNIDVHAAYARARCTAFTSGELRVAFHQVS